MAIRSENSIGYRIVQALGAKDLKEAAQILGENYSSLYNWSSQRRDFPTNVLIKIARMTNKTVDWLLTGENDESVLQNEHLNFEQILEQKIRSIVRDELANDPAIQEKIQ
jgi:hypothetical protein